jgi:adenosylmethionine-8-amino-7-oxononanoate aminotransferase
MTHSHDAIQTDLDHLIHPLYHPMAHQQPRIWVEGQGSLITDMQGHTCIDGLSGLWCVNIGHGRHELANVAQAQMSTLAYCSSYTGSSNLPAIHLAERLSQIMPASINTFFFTSGGAESSESSFKMARSFWKIQGKPDKIKIISRMKGYHGVTMAAMSATGLPNFWPMFEPRVPHFLHIESPYPYRFVNPDPSISPGIAAANLLEEAILREGPETVAAFIAEPVQGAGGVIVPPTDYFARIREICDKYEVLLIADEVITGFARTGRWFGVEHYGIEPDILQFAKGITSGYVPLGGIGISDRLRDAIHSLPPSERWMHAYTYSGHPTTCAVALENIAIIEREGLVQQAAERGAQLLEGLQALYELRSVGDVRGLGMMAAVELVADKESKQPFAATQGVGVKIGDELAKRGLFTRIVGDTICLAPPLVTSAAQIEQIISIVGDTIAAVAP